MQPGRYSRPATTPDLSPPTNEVHALRLSSPEPARSCLHASGHGCLDQGRPCPLERLHECRVLVGSVEREGRRHLRIGSRKPSGTAMKA
jgi:hypothetical protein